MGKSQQSESDNSPQARVTVMKIELQVKDDTLDENEIGCARLPLLHRGFQPLRHQHAKARHVQGWVSFGPPA